MSGKVAADGTARRGSAHQCRAPHIVAGERPGLAFDQPADLGDDLVGLSRLNGECRIPLSVERLEQIDVAGAVWNFDEEVAPRENRDTRPFEDERAPARVQRFRYDGAAERAHVLRTPDDNSRRVGLAVGRPGYEVLLGHVGERVDLDGLRDDRDGWFGIHAPGACHRSRHRRYGRRRDRLRARDWGTREQKQHTRSSDLHGFLIASRKSQVTSRSTSLYCELRRWDFRAAAGLPRAWLISP